MVYVHAPYYREARVRREKKGRKEKTRRRRGRKGRREREIRYMYMCTCKIGFVGKKRLHCPGIEPGSQEWESCMIPLHQQCYAEVLLVHLLMN